jgi:hypothetical protein
MKGISMKQNSLRQAANLLAVLVTLVINILANALPLNGQNTGQISDSFKVFFVPAGYVFSIWGLIYIGLLAYGIYQALPSQRDNPRLRSIDGLFLVSSAANSLWIFAWHYNIFSLTIVLMLILLASLIGIYLRLNNGNAEITAGERWTVQKTFSVYLGWITVATIANAADVLYYWKWNGFGIDGQIWTLIVLAAALAIAFTMTITRRDTAYLLVLVWAFAGIVVKQSGAPLVAGASAVSAVLVAMMALYTLWPRGLVRQQAFGN